MEVSCNITIRLWVKRELLSIFFQLFEQGFIEKTRAKSNVKDFLCDHLGLNKDYLEKKIQTIFLDGKPVDDVNSAMVSQGATIALSAAMPGLAGATLRKDGHYAAMRLRVLNDQNFITEPDWNKQVIVKFFNLVAKDLGPAFLEQGLLIKGENLMAILKRYSGQIKAGCASAQIDGVEIAPDRLIEINVINHFVLLKTHSEPET